MPSTRCPQHRLLDVVRYRLPDEGIVRLIERMVLTETGRGLRQGGCLSPLLLNLYLDHHLDRRWRMRHPDLPLIRVADDILVLTRNQEEAQQTWTDLREMLLPAGMPLKGYTVISNSEPIHWRTCHLVGISHHPGDQTIWRYD